MSMSGTPTAFRPLEPQKLAESIAYTQQRTGFSSLLIEKDYFCSLLLQNLMLLTTCATELVLKGGTCLSKIHLNFYRLSEDLDFAVDIRKAGARKKVISQIKAEIANLPGNWRWVKPLIGHNESTHYKAMLAYPSVITPSGKIEIEISLREPLLCEPESKPAKTLLIDAVTGTSVLSPFPVQTMTLEECLAEK